MKKISLILALVLLVSLLAGCAGTPVIYYTECDCPEGGVAAPADPKPADPKPAEPQTPPAASAEGALKTGLYIGASTADSVDGKASYDVTMAAVLVDDNGVIQQCIIDGISASVEFDAAGAITTDLTAPVQTKNELGPDYGMVAWNGAIAEWDAQAAALAAYAVGKTVDELKNGAIDESGYAKDADLAASATINLFGGVFAIEGAVANAQHLGAQAGDTLKLASINTIDGSTNATAEAAGLAELYINAVALTMNGDVITSCALDAVQAKVNFGTDGVITGELTKHVLTKNELGPDYGMVAWAGAIAEWNAQAASFAAYVTGKTPAEVAGIAVSENKPTDADLASSVTIKINGFQDLIAKACA